MPVCPPAPQACPTLTRLLVSGQIATSPIRSFEPNDIGMQQAMRMFALPRWMNRIYVWYLRYIKRDEIYAGLIEGWHEKRITEYWQLVAQREDYRLRWFEMWEQEELDFVLTVPNALPAVPHGGMKEGFKACGYSFLFNLVSESSGSSCNHLKSLSFRSSSTIRWVFSQSPTFTKTWIGFPSRPSSNRGTPLRRGHIRCTILRRCVVFLLAYRLLGDGSKRRRSWRE